MGSAPPQVELLLQHRQSGKMETHSDLVMGREAAELEEVSVLADAASMVS